MNAQIYREVPTKLEYTSIGVLVNIAITIMELPRSHKIMEKAMKIPKEPVWPVYIRIQSASITHFI